MGKLFCEDKGDGREGVFFFQIEVFSSDLKIKIRLLHNEFHTVFRHAQIHYTTGMSNTWPTSYIWPAVNLSVANQAYSISSILDSICV